MILVKKFIIKICLSLALTIKNIIENSLSKTGRTDVKFELDGSGENVNKAPFENKTPEERSYNRTVIDIVPAKKIG
jgi:hypothetical protein